jgi:hypothetical protein
MMIDMRVKKILAHQRDIQRYCKAEGTGGLEKAPPKRG